MFIEYVKKNRMVSLLSKGKVVVGMSGGVDSAVATYLLKDAGYEVFGVTVKTRDTKNNSEIEDAKRTAQKICVPFQILDATALFRKKVVEPFISDYLNARTPNPCVLCNRKVKWESLTNVANAINADFIATGHYASIKKINDRYAVGTPKDNSKDQSYMLYNLSQEDLSQTIFPLAELSKIEVRELAKKIGLDVAEKKDSQEICFIPDGDYAKFLEMNAKIPGTGNFVDSNGNILGKHKGIIHYTVGQRKGLELAMGYPVYVKKICPRSNEVVVSCNEELYTDEIVCEQINFMGISAINEDENISAKVKIRYRHAGEHGTLKKMGDKIKITFENKVRAAAPGQSAVFYNDDNIVLGGGIIVDRI